MKKDYYALTAWNRSNVDEIYMLPVTTNDLRILSWKRFQWGRNYKNNTYDLSGKDFINGIFVSNNYSLVQSQRVTSLWPQFRCNDEYHRK